MAIFNSYVKLPEGNGFNDEIGSMLIVLKHLQCDDFTGLSLRHTPSSTDMDRDR